MLASAHDVAREIRNRIPGAGVVKIHKLLYLAAGHYAAWTGQAMFAEDIEAWEMGPVVADLWRDEKNHRNPPQPADLDADMMLAIELVVSRYGSLPGRDLIDLTHGQRPWLETWRQGLGESNVIPVAALSSYFRSEMPDDDETIDAAALRQVAERFAPEVTTHPGDDTEALRQLLVSLR